MFNYYEPVSPDEKNLYDHDEAWLQEQQSKFNYAKLSDIDPEKAGLMHKLNETAMKRILEAKDSNDHPIFATDIDIGIPPQSG